jgi:hypothetical protein
VDGFEVAYGATLGGDAASQCVDRNDAATAAVRCCADTLGSCHFPSSQPTPLPSPQPTPAPTAEPTRQPTPQPSPDPSPKPSPEPTLDRSVDTCSAKACADLGWTNAASFGSNTVCGESHVVPDAATGTFTAAGTEAECAGSGAYTWAEARTTCQFVGARLCTYVAVLLRTCLGVCFLGESDLFTLRGSHSPKTQPLLFLPTFKDTRSWWRATRRERAAISTASR